MVLPSPGSIVENPIRPPSPYPLRGEREGEETEKGDSCPFRLHINPALVFRYVNASLYLDQYLGLYNTLGSVDPLRRWTHAAGFTGVCACTTRADTYTCVRCNCRTRQTGYPRGSSTPTPHRDTDSNTERGGGGGGDPSAPSSYRPGGNTAALLSFVPLHLPSASRRGYARSNAEVTRTHTRLSTDPSRHDVRNRDSDLSSRGVRCRFEDDSEDDALFDNFGPRF